VKSTGIVRKVDELGRIVIPMELRRGLGIKEKDPVEIFIDGEQIIFQKYTIGMTCDVTGDISENNDVFLDGKLVLSHYGKKVLLEEIKKSYVKN
jgi:transcriptional pleiotropic regulator of transition state genes